VISNIREVLIHPEAAEDFQGVRTVSAGEDAFIKEMDSRKALSAGLDETFVQPPSWAYSRSDPG
jgi:hypothetical protein